MALRGEVRQRFHRLKSGSMGGYWFHETGSPGWTRSWHGYPYLHMLEMGFMPPYDAKQELDLLRIEAGKLEIQLGKIRRRIRDLEIGMK